MQGEGQGWSPNLAPLSITANHWTTCRRPCPPCPPGPADIAEASVWLRAQGVDTFRAARGFLLENPWRLPAASPLLFPLPPLHPTQIPQSDNILRDFLQFSNLQPFDHSPHLPTRENPNPTAPLPGSVAALPTHHHGPSGMHPPVPLTFPVGSALLLYHSQGHSLLRAHTLMRRMFCLHPNYPVLFSSWHLPSATPACEHSRGQEQTASWELRACFV